ncbi:hypothetical protein CR205_05855 [Alteribacter lacisalsi]|uniref:Uncharacterized protein n=1 Tax=Alteribacter lacisalsi TaxID=2045244 RepID=A0A2W0HML4_9BACI|nr:hypothetical protein CR205_05855 [Alteribacter lacisalsi]
MTPAKRVCFIIKLLIASTQRAPKDMLAEEEAGIIPDKTEARPAESVHLQRFKQNLSENIFFISNRFLIFI